MLLAAVAVAMVCPLRSVRAAPYLIGSIGVSDGASLMDPGATNPATTTVGLDRAFFADCTGDFAGLNLTIYTGPVGTLGLTLVTDANPGVYTLASDAVLDLGMLDSKQLRAVVTSPQVALRTYSTEDGQETVTVALAEVTGYLTLDGVRDSDFLGTIGASITGVPGGEYSQSWQGTFTAVPVPEPAGVAMLVGCVALGTVVRRRRTHR